MNTHTRLRLAIALAACAAIASCTAKSSGQDPSAAVSAAPRSSPAAASPSPSPSTSVTATETVDLKYSSALNKYTMSYPEGWTVVAGKKAWVSGQDPAASQDVFQSPEKRAVTVVSQKLPAGWTTAKWYASFLPAKGTVAMPQCFPGPKEWLPVTVDGHSGGLLGGDFGCSFTEAIVLANGRAYVFNAVPDRNQANTDIFDQGLFNQILASVHLTS